MAEKVPYVEAPYHDRKTTLTNEEVNNPKAGPDQFHEKRALVENVEESPALDPRDKTTDAYVIPR